MPDIWLDVDAALAEVPVNIMPLLDDTDFKSRETSIAYNASGMDLVWNFVTPDGAMSQTAVTPTTGGNYDWAHLGDGMYTIEIPASGGASINNDTEGFGWFTGLVTGVLPWRGPIIGFRAAGLNDKLIETAYSATRGLAGTALPDAAADGAGGLPISDAGGLDLDAQIKTDIDAILEDTGTTLDALIKDIPTNAELTTALGTADDATLAAIAAVDGKIDTIDNFLDTEIAAILEDTGTTLDALIKDIPTNAELATALGTADDATLAAIAAVDGKIDTIDNFLDTEIAAILEDTGTTLDALIKDIPTNAELATALGTADDATLAAIAAVDGKIDTIDNLIDTEVAAILADTNELQTDWANGGRLDLILDAAGAAGDPWGTALPGAYGAGTAGKIVGDNINAPIATVDTVVDAIKAKTDQLAFTVANQVDANALTGAAAEVDEEALGEAMWTYGSRTLTMTPAEIVAVAVEGTISQTRGNDWTITFTGLTFTGTNMQFAIKGSTSQADSAAPLLIDEAGLQYLNGVAVLLADRTKATMTYADGTLTITVKASITAQLDPGIYHYGLQDIDGAGLVAESYMGEFTITADVVRGTT